MNENLLLAQRRAGVLLHITSLPGSFEFGDLGQECYRFIDFLADCGISVWQTLPIGPPNFDLSPYQCFSVHAGNPQLISLDWLKQKGWLNSKLDPTVSSELGKYRLCCIDDSYHNFSKVASTDERQKLDSFIEKNADWLQDYALYIVLRDKYQMRSWIDWSEPFRNRNAGALQAFAERNKTLIDSIKFQQFVFFEQWYQLKAYANEQGILMLGDMPIFVAHDSVDVWSHPDLFTLDEKGRATYVTGVPPDYFSTTGQRWGNPQYRWDRMEIDHFDWWINRFRTQIDLFDGIRIDHFRGLSAYWEIPGEDATAENGRWVDAPGEKLLQALTRSFPNLSMIAEDLGTITPDVIELRDKFKLPGMCILQFAFDGNPDNPYLSENHKKYSVTYTGTHDNDTTLSWFESQSVESQRYIIQHLMSVKQPMPWPMIITALNSVSQLAIIPMQDILGLGYGYRMNVPGTVDGNWTWRFSWEQVDPSLSEKVFQLISQCKRIK